MVLFHASRFSRLALVLLVALLAGGCLHGSPDPLDPVPGGSITVYPETEGELVSDDQRVVVRFEAGTVTQPTTFSITRIPQGNYPDQILLQSDIYQIEPSRPLAKAVRITFDMNGLAGNGFTLSQLYTLDALTLRELLPGKPAAFVAVEETTVDDWQGQPHRVLRSQLDRLGAFGLFVHDCYVMCRKSVECPSWPSDPNMTPKQQIARCMTEKGCPSNIAAMNSAETLARFDCALGRSCRDAFGCCLESPPCGIEPDGDEPPDGDESPDGDTPPDGDQPADGDDPVDGDVDPDGDTDTDGDDTPPVDFRPRTCMGPEHCSGQACVTVVPDERRCLAMSSDPVRLYTAGTPGTWTEVPGGPLPVIDCAGIAPPTETAGDYVFDLRIELDTWWPVPAAEGIQVALSLETNPNTPFLVGALDATGKVDFSSVSLTDEWFLIRLWRDSDTPAQRIVPTWHWGNFVTNEEAAGANLNGQPVRIKVMPIDAARYDTFAKALGISSGIPSGHGMVMGQVSDCRRNPPYVVANASVGFLEATPLVMGYFDDQATFPTPDQARIGTNKNGLFAAIYLPPADVLTAFAFGTVRNNEFDSVELLGLTVEGHLRLAPDTVTIVRFNRFR